MGGFAGRAEGKPVGAPLAPSGPGDGRSLILAAGCSGDVGLATGPLRHNALSRDRRLASRR